MKKEKLKIVYEDKSLIIVDKKSGLLTISTFKEHENTLYKKVSAYVKKQNKNNRIFIIHRLDKDTSGLIMFAKNEKVKRIMQANWPLVIRKYVGIVHDKVTTKQNILKNYLKENQFHYVYSTNNKNGKLAITEYQVLETNNKYSLLDIQIKTGRKHQIRVQLNNIGHPLVGDKIYAKALNKGYQRLYLDAYYLEFYHPLNQQLIKIEKPFPKEFTSLMK